MIHVIAQSHIDPVFMWPWREGMAEISNTCKAAVGNLKKYPQLKFVRSDAQAYEWIRSIDPELFAEIRDLVRQERWFPVGGWVTQADTNLPGGESLIRQALLGQKVFEEMFGLQSEVAYLVDSFGHPSTMPKILQHSGFKYFVFSRPGEKWLKLPAPLFHWDSDDGSSILSYRIPVSYTTYAEEIERLNDVKELQPEWLEDIMGFFGLGNHGGGPTEQQLLRLIDYAKHPECPDFAFSDPASYFQRVQDNPQIPHFSGSLKPFSIGCYSVGAGLKRSHDWAQNEILGAETYLALAQALGHEVSARELALLNEAWKDILFVEFHDLLPGSAIKEGLDRATSLADGARAKSEQLKSAALTRIANKIDCSGQGYVSLVAFNNTSLSGTFYFEYEPWLFWQEWGDYDLIDETGRSVPHQLIQPEPASAGLTRLLVKTELPGRGYRLLRVVGPEPDLGSISPAPENDVVVRSKVAEEATTTRHRITFDRLTGTIDSITHLQQGWSSSFGRLGDAIVLKDRSDTWSIHLDKYQEYLGRFSDPQIRILDEGPFLWTAGITRTFEESTMAQDVRLYDDSDVIEIRNRIDWHQPWQLLKIVIPSPFADAEVIRGLAFGSEQVGGDREFVFQNWLLLRAKGAESEGGLRTLGVVVGPGIHSADWRDNALRLTLLRAPVFCHEELNRTTEVSVRHRHMDFGEHETTFALIPSQEDLSVSQLVEHSRRLHDNVSVVTTNRHAGKLAPSGALFEVDAQNVSCSAVKVSEDKQGYIVRLWETAGIDTSGRLGWLGHEIDFEIKAHALLALKLIPDGDGYEVEQVDGLEKPLACRADVVR